MEPTVRFTEFKDSWNNYKIEDMFDRVGTPVDLDDTQTYREIGIRSHGKGIFHKEETTATEIGNKRVFWVEPDRFVVNIVFAWERAVAKTTEKENGMIGLYHGVFYYKTWAKCFNISVTWWSWQKQNIRTKRICKKCCKIAITSRTTENCRVLIND